MPARSYPATTSIFHWLTVLLLILQYAVGWLMPEVHHGTQPVGLIGWHLAIGTVLMAVVVMRFAWRLKGPTLAPLDTTAPLAQRLAKLLHGFLYLLLLSLPLMGWANASSRGWHISLLGIIPMPALAPTGSRIGHALGDIHQLTAWGLLGVVALHVSAVLYHHLVLRDDTLRRMLSWKS